ncbi:pre-mRNA processing factor 3 (PRP3) [Teratosphaeria destructans]|uniref:Pre-mRNA processing factor 3 (PRP3) n=1 Tax=Teratosphaeria destructans TaxID=418781 RepID=A0A9W7SRN6_9PEZI|nr:pre-mRNA processing factor 3 (PRP3) [Teratosphaeria destructans]
MASTTGKRPFPDGDDSDAKRIRSNNGSPAPPPPAVSGGASEMEQKRADAQRKIAEMKARMAQKAAANGAATTQVSAAGPPASDIEAKKAEAQRKIAEMKAKMAAKARTATPVHPAASDLTSPPSSEPSDRDKKLEEVRKRAELLAKRAQEADRSQQRHAIPPPPPRTDSGRTARGGLGIGLHPSLLGEGPAASTKSKPGPRFSTTKGNYQPDAPRVNLYLAATDDAETRHDEEVFDPTVPARKTAERKSRQLVFNQKGKFMAQANALRQQARLEEMKKRIAAETRKTEIEEASDKAFLVPVPPEVEWWDEGLLTPDGDLKIDTDDTIITALVQHPVILQAPQDKFQPAPKPLMLTPKEQKKLRRQRRMADMKEEQAKIRLGLVEPPPPKVKKSNMMRVLGEQAVKDPTAVEARVNREIAQRANDHARANAERALTKEQRAEKLKQQQAADEAKGVKVCVFRVDNLSSGKHRYQVDQNAKQHALTGIVILHPEMNLIIVEGGVHSITAFKKLMLHRIKWSENTLPLSNSSGPSTFIGANDGTSKGQGSEANKAAQWLSPVDERGQLKDLGANRCVLVWEGDEAARSFKRWGSKACETDGEAKDVLGRSKMENMWTLARSLEREDGG